MTIFRLVITALLTSTFFLSVGGAAEIEETVLGMNVSGNKEAPNLLYIIPWKEISTEANPPEIYRLMDEVYSTVDPDVFEKDVGFYQQLTTANEPKKDD